MNLFAPSEHLGQKAAASASESANASSFAATENPTHQGTQGRTAPYGFRGAPIGANTPPVCFRNIGGDNLILLLADANGI